MKVYVFVVAAACTLAIFVTMITTFETLKDG
jgi:hypothetical protein